jgi:hypothetical protein
VNVAPVAPYNPNVVNTTQAQIDAAVAKYGQDAYNQSTAGKAINIQGVPNTPVP